MEAHPRQPCLSQSSSTAASPCLRERVLISLLGCEGSGHHGLTRLIQTLVSWVSPSVLVIDTHPAWLKHAIEVHKVSGLCDALKAPFTGAAMQAYSFPDYLYRNASDPRYDLTWLHNATQRCPFRVKHLVVAFRRGLLDRIAAGGEYNSSEPSRVREQPWVMKFKALRSFLGVNISAAAYAHEQLVFERRLNTQLAALRAVPRHELWYDDVASNCTQAALALVGFLEAHGVAQTRKLSFACNQFHATRAPVEARMNSDDIAQVRALLAQEEAR